MTSLRGQFTIVPLQWSSHQFLIVPEILYLKFLMVVPLLSAGAHGCLGAFPILQGCGQKQAKRRAVCALQIPLSAQGEISSSSSSFSILSSISQSTQHKLRSLPIVGQNILQQADVGLMGEMHILRQQLSRMQAYNIGKDVFLEDKNGKPSSNEILDTQIPQEVCPTKLTSMIGVQTHPTTSSHSTPLPTSDSSPAKQSACSPFRPCWTRLPLVLSVIGQYPLPGPIYMDFKTRFTLRLVSLHPYA